MLQEKLVVVQSLSHVWLFVTPWTVAHQASLSFTISLSFLKLTSIESVMPSIHLILFFLSPLALNLSSIRVFSIELVLCIRWPNYWSFSFNTRASKEWIMLLLLSRFSYVWLFLTPWTVAHQASLSFPISWSLLKLMSTESVMLSNHLILCHPLLLLPSIFPASGSFPMNQLFPWGGQSIGVPASSSNEHSGLISFRMDWLDPWHRFKGLSI